MINPKELKNNFPKCWKELNEFYNDHYSNDAMVEVAQALELPFAFTVGIWMHFFQDNGFDLDVQSLDLRLIEVSVMEHLQALENTIGHFS